MSKVKELNEIFHSVRNSLGEAVIISSSEPNVATRTISPEELTATVGIDNYTMSLCCRVLAVTHNGRSINIENLLEGSTPAKLADDLLALETPGHPFSRQEGQSADTTNPLYVEFEIIQGYEFNEAGSDIDEKKRKITIMFTRAHDEGQIFIDDEQSRRLNAGINADIMTDLSGNEVQPVFPEKTISVPLGVFINYLRAIERWSEFDFSNVVRNNSKSTPGSGDKNVYRL